MALGSLTWRITRSFPSHRAHTLGSLSNTRLNLANHVIGAGIDVGGALGSSGHRERFD
ncbi:MAG: hypothetical protein ACI8PT_003779 [Gammaproteobacteria bacterium]|jgi:hypothetical protein